MFRVSSIRTMSAPLLMAAILVFCLSTSAFATDANGNILITVDENCFGVLNGFAGLESMPCTLQTDPGPGGGPNALTYDMLNPPGLVPGDVLLHEQVGGALVISDIIRFNFNADGVGTLLFYSDNSDGIDALADIASMPGQYYTNHITINEIGSEGSNGAFYTPIQGQPGFVSGATAPVTYNFISDSPEPASFILLASGAALLFASRLRRKSRG
jgi:hypothetical protein